MAKDREACGRCSMTSVVDMTDDEDGPDPFDGPRIEVSQDAVRRASFPAVWLGRAKRRLDATATRLVYGR